MIKKGQIDKLELGNMDSQRDWGHSKDYVKAMHLIMNYKVPNDWVVATGETRSIRDFCEYAFNLVNLNYLDYVVQNDKYKRPLELDFLRGDSTKTRELLNWKPEYTFESMIEEMLEYWMNKL